VTSLSSANARVALKAKPSIASPAIAANVFFMVFSYCFAIGGVSFHQLASRGQKVNWNAWATKSKRQRLFPLRREPRFAPHAGPRCVEHEPTRDRFLQILPGDVAA